MDETDFGAQFLTGKDDKPALFAFGPLEYNRSDIDGLYYMLDRDLSGCLVLGFTKPMDPAVRGCAALSGEPLPSPVLKFMPIMSNLWILGVPVRGFVNEYGREYTLHIEGYQDTDGNLMCPQDFTVKCSDRVYPQEEFAAHEAVALQAAEEGIVLLKNENNLLPLAEGTTMNIFGRGVNQFRTSAVGAGKINPRYTVDFVEAIRENENLKLNEALCAFYRLDSDPIPDAELLADARAKSDLAVMMITRGTGENMDGSSAKGSYYLTDEEDALIQKLTASFPHVLAILNTGYPVDVSWANRYGVEALVYCGFGGMLAGKALVNILTGITNPSGKLPDTWARDYFDIPASRNFYDSVDKPFLDTNCGIYADTCYEEDIYVGYRYFKTFDVAPAYPFGFGLSYTTFAVKAANVTLCGADITVTNTGSRPGKEVIQVYVRKPEPRVETPERELVWFGKTRELEPGSVETLHATFEPEDFAVWEPEHSAWVLPEGEYTIFIGTDVNAPEVCGIKAAAMKILRQGSTLVRAPKEPVALTKHDPVGSFPQGLRSRTKPNATAFEPAAERKVFPAVFAGKAPPEKMTFIDVKAKRVRAADFVAQLSIAELARLSVCASTGWGMEGVGEAGRVYQIEGWDIPNFPVADGNSGVNLRIPNIGMPSTVTMSASFNPELLEAVGRVIGEEAKALGIPLILAPGMNLHRNPLNGRHPEYFSEDPYLAGILAGHYCRGMENAGVGSCIKHLVANNCESTRKRNMSIISQRALRELYLKAFTVAMRVHMPASVMSGYNAVNGCHTAEDPELLLGFLRGECGFDGFIMTDWGSYDTADVAKMVQAGTCWITPGSMDDTYTKRIMEGVANGSIDPDRLRENVAYLIKTMARFTQT